MMTDDKLTTLAMAASRASNFSKCLFSSFSVKATSIIASINASKVISNQEKVNMMTYRRTYRMLS